MALKFLQPEPSGASSPKSPGISQTAAGKLCFHKITIVRFHDYIDDAQLQSLSARGLIQTIRT